MDKIEKALRKLTPKERQLFTQLLQLIQQRQFAGLDMKRLVGHDDIYRVRKGKYRIIFRVDEDQVFVLALERRSDQTYSKY